MYFEGPFGETGLVPIKGVEDRDRGMAAVRAMTELLVAARPDEERPVETPQEPLDNVLEDQ